jgi:hypothetical protein
MVLYFKPRNVSAGFFLLRVNDLTPAIRQMPVSINCRGFDYRSHTSAPQSLSAGEDQRHQALRWSWLDRKLLTG